MKFLHRPFLAIATLLALCATLLAFDTTPKPVAPDGTKAIIDIPTLQHMQNTGGTDGYGLCVPTSVTVAAKWHNLPELYGFRKFAEGRPGGSYPEQLDSDLKLYASRNKIKLPPFIQHTGGDDAFLDLLMATRRMGGITYAGVDGFYDSPVAHMVNSAHLDATRGAIIDNNRPGNWVWMTRAQLLNRWKGLHDDGKAMLVPVRQGVRTIWVPVGGGWCFAFLGPPAPPVPPSFGDPMVVPPTPEEAPVYVWERTLVEGKIYWFLYSKGSLIFVVDPDGKYHVAISDNEWEAEAIEKPADVPGPDRNEPTRAWNHGVMNDRVSRAYRYWIDGVECSRVKAFAATIAPVDGLVDDSDRYHLSVVGDRAKILPLFAPGGSLEKYAPRLHVQIYSAADWPTQDRLKAVVTLQEPAKIGGKIATSASSADEAALKKALGDVFDPPVPPKPPTDPTKPVDPTKPADPITVPELPGWLKALLLALASILGYKLIAPNASTTRK